MLRLILLTKIYHFRQVLRALKACKLVWSSQSGRNWMVLKYKMGIRYCGFNIKKGRGQSNYPFLMRMLITGEREIPPFLRSGSRDFEPLAVPVLGLVSNSRPQFVMFVFVCCCFSAVHYQNQSIIFHGDSRKWEIHERSWKTAPARGLRVVFS